MRKRTRALSADEIQLKIYSQMPFAQKWEELCRMRIAAKELKAASLRLKHPRWNNSKIEAEVRKIFLYATT